MNKSYFTRVGFIRTDIIRRDYNSITRILDVLFINIGIEYYLLNLSVRPRCFYIYFPKGGWS